MRPNQWQFLAFLGGSLFILLFNLWGRTLENHDYLRYAEVAKEMIQSGDWIVPRFNGDIYLHKPPFLFWLIALPSKIYGSVTPFLARLPSAFFAWLGVVVVFLWGRKVGGDDQSGFISSGVLLSSYLYFWQGRISRTDMVFSMLVLLSLYFFYLSYHKGSVCLLTPISFAFMGLAGLTKGPVGLLLPLSVVILFLMVNRQFRFLIRRDFLSGYFVIILIWSLWLVPFLLHVGWDKALEVWQETKILTRREPFYLYGYRIWVDFAPWSIFLPSLLFYYWRKEKGSDEKFLIIWFFCLLFILTLFPYRASKYILPAFPALALLMGGFWRNRSIALFWELFLGAIVAWHGYEFILIHGNENRSRGGVIEKELRPFRRDISFAYQMDIDVLGKINFYGDTVIPQTNRIGDIKRQMSGKQEVFVITPQKGTEDLTREGFHLTPIKIIEHKDMSFILCKLQ